MKRIFAVLLTLFMLATPLAIPVYANSGEKIWEGVDSTGAIIFGDSCPIEVAKEVLTFDLSELPEDNYDTMEEYLSYTGKVTAEYTFYNPTELTITATLVFPFATQPDYANIYDNETQTYLAFADTEKYDITLNGEAIDKEIRCTLKPPEETFNLSEDISRLSDSYITDGFYSPTMPVTKYTYRVDQTKKVWVAFDWSGGDGSTRIYFPKQRGLVSSKNGDSRHTIWVDNSEDFSVYVIGKPLSEPFKMRCYQNSFAKDNEIAYGIVSLTNTETMTLEDLTLENWSEETGISKVDWYNAAITAFNEDYWENFWFTSKYNYVLDYYGLSESADNFMKNLMRWYEYEITIEPKSSITNTVTAPIYPEIKELYEPDIYDYRYLLSPASTWASFGDLEIIINTPFYITESSIDGFTKTETGYVLNHNGLPKGELEFTLCTSKNPKLPKSSRRNIPIEAIIFFSIVGVVVILIGVTVFLIIRKKKTKKK